MGENNSHEIVSYNDAIDIIVEDLKTDDQERMYVSVKIEEINGRWVGYLLSCPRFVVFGHTRLSVRDDLNYLYRGLKSVEYMNKSIYEF